MQSSVKDALREGEGGYLEPMSDNSEIDMTSDTEAEGPCSSTFSRGHVSSEEYPDKLKTGEKDHFTMGAKIESIAIKASAGARQP